MKIAQTCINRLKIQSLKTSTHMTHLTETLSKNYNENITQSKSGFKLWLKVWLLETSYDTLQAAGSGVYTQGA